VLHELRQQSAVFEFPAALERMSLVWDRCGNEGYAVSAVRTLREVTFTAVDAF